MIRLSSKTKATIPVAPFKNLGKFLEKGIPEISLTEIETLLKSLRESLVKDLRLAKPLNSKIVGFLLDLENYNKDLTGNYINNIEITRKESSVEIKVVDNYLKELGVNLLYLIRCVEYGVFDKLRAGYYWRSMVSDLKRKSKKDLPSDIIHEIVRVSSGFFKNQCRRVEIVRAG